MAEAARHFRTVRLKQIIRRPGAIIDYYLKSAASGPITLEILDAKGKSVRTYSSAEGGGGGGGRGRGGAALKIFPRTGIARRKLFRPRRACIAGRGTFITQLRLTPEAVAVDVAEAAVFGPCPGIYTVKLTADGKSYTQHARRENGSARENSAARIAAAIRYRSASVREIRGSCEGARRSHTSARANHELFALKRPEILRCSHRSMHSTRKPPQSAESSRRLLRIPAELPRRRPTLRV